MLTYEETAPPAALAAFVRCFWTLRGEGDPARPDRILPDGSFEMVFHRGDSFVRDGERQPRAMLVGEIRRPTIVTSSRRTDVFGIRFRLGGLGILGLHARAIRDHIVDLRDLMTEQQMIQWASGHPPVRTSEEPVPHQSLRAAVRAIVRTNGDVRIGELVSSIGTTERTLERHFDKHVGLGPKELARVVRFQAALRGIDGGYYDDSHRIHDFLEFAGRTPSAVFAERNEVTDAFVGNLQYGDTSHP